MEELFQTQDRLPPGKSEKNKPRFAKVDEGEEDEWAVNAVGKSNDVTKIKNKDKNRIKKKTKT